MGNFAISCVSALASILLQIKGTLALDNLGELVSLDNPVFSSRLGSCSRNAWVS